MSNLSQKSKDTTPRLSSIKKLSCVMKYFISKKFTGSFNKLENLKL